MKWLSSTQIVIYKNNFYKFIHNHFEDYNKKTYENLQQLINTYFS